MAAVSSPEEILAGLERFGIRLGLETTRSLLAELGNPQDDYPVVLVGGTNGKGSTAAVMASIATQAGYTPGLFISPHLETVLERVRLGDRPIGSEELASRLSAVISLAERRLGHPPSYFEAICVAALWWFAECKAELAILEVGLGGRLDATNVCDPELSIVTNVSHDHRAQLGNTVASIASEKAGIFRSGRIAWTAAEGEALETLGRVASGVGAELKTAADTASTEVLEEGLRGQVLVLETSLNSYRLVTSLAGAHQRSNLELAVLAAQSLGAAGFDRIDRTAIETGVARCRWPGRLELVEIPESSNGNGHEVLLDVAHNPAGFAALADFVERHFPSYDLLFGALRGKEAASHLGRLAAGADRVVLTRPNSPRAECPDALASVVTRAREGRVLVEPVPERALDLALTETGRLLACGSLYLVGEIRGLLRARFGVPAPPA